LANSPELNGVEGVCEEWSSSTGRWTVLLLEGDARSVAVKPENLTRAGMDNSASPAQDALKAARAVASRCRDEGNKSEERRQRRANLAAPRRRRLVEETLQVVRNDFEPAAGLEEAAAAAAREALSRTEDAQREAAASLAQPRVLPEVASMGKPPVVLRSRAEQQERCEELSRPRELPTPAATSAWQLLQGAQVAARSAAEQQKRCAELAQPRTAPGEMDPSAEDVFVLPKAVWREVLAARANAPVPEGLAEAKEWLARRLPPVNESTKEFGSAPASPRRRVVDVTDPELLHELQEVVEELLWVVLLQIRGCPKSASVTNTALEERLSNLLLGAVGPALRPVARRVLGPGTGVVRRLRSEFPRLCLHLGFRESEEVEPSPATWTSEEIASRVQEVRMCRDELLANDLTKALLACVT
jgi:hypothetical protein